MKQKQRGNLLLLELIIVIILFAFCAVILSGVFGAAFRMEKRTRARDNALYEAQNIADRLYAEEDREMVLLDCAFTESGEGLWQKQSGDYSIGVQFTDEDPGLGKLQSANLTVTAGDETLFTLPVSRYVEVQP